MIYKINKYYFNYCYYYYSFEIVLVFISLIYTSLTKIHSVAHILYKQKN
jgi:hypothetical protein